MALIRYPLGEQRSGRTGGVVHSHNRAGPYNRAASIPVNPQTTRQNVIRGYMTSLSNAWFNILTQDQRDAWDQYGASKPVKNRLGMTMYLTGQNQYVRCNVPRLQAGFTVINEGPTNLTDAPGILDLGCTASAATQLLTVTWAGWTSWEDDDDTGMLVKMGAPQNASRKFFGGPWRYNDVILGDSITPAASPAVLSAAPFVFAEGQRIWIEARITMDDGRLGDVVRYDFLGAA
jgi:hypothetical protein